MKDYYQRLKKGSSVTTVVFWWLIRITLSYGLISCLGEETVNYTDAVYLGAGFICTFIWEICMAFPKKSCFTVIPSSLQTAFTVIVFLGAFVGRYLNLYETTSWFKAVVQFAFASFTLFAGYEAGCAYIRKKQKKATKALLYYVAFSVCFLLINVTELFEFTSDQIIGIITGVAGDAQYWSFEAFEGTARQFAVIDPIYSSRWTIMDTMTDILIGTVAAFVFLLVLNLYPYRQKGRFMYTDMVLYVADTLPDDKAVPYFKRYIARIKANCSTRVYVFWWLIRGFMLVLIIQSFFKKPFDPIITIELLMNFACMFIWEISMAMPAKNVFRYMPPILQTLITLGDFMAVIAGYLFNFYYEVRLWDSFLHFFFPFCGVFFGYEIACALAKMERKKAPLALALVTSAGFCFMCSIFWEIFEFSCDQFVGMMSGMPSDVQHWNYQLALGTPKFQTIFDPINSERWALMDTMGDVVLNTAGIFLGLGILIVLPYRHKGRFKYDFDFEKQAYIKR